MRVPSSPRMVDLVWYPPFCRPKGQRPANILFYKEQQVKCLRAGPSITWRSGAATALAAIIKRQQIFNLPNCDNEMCIYITAHAPSFIGLTECLVALSLYFFKVFCKEKNSNKRFHKPWVVCIGFQSLPKVPSLVCHFFPLTAATLHNMHNHLKENIMYCLIQMLH